jgi:NAD-dependent SIR2 family protein deacetylase
MASVARLLQSRKRILVLAGAGISVSCGIKDFRSPNGLYATLDTEVRLLFAVLSKHLMGLI